MLEGLKDPEVTQGYQVKKHLIENLRAQQNRDVANMYLVYLKKGKGVLISFT